MAHSNIDQPTAVKTQNLVMSIVRVKPDKVNGTLNEGLGQINVPKYCDINPSSNCQDAQNVTLMVKQLINYNN